jgi:iron complex outermembrane receptor protein
VTSFRYDLLKTSLLVSAAACAAMAAGPAAAQSKAFRVPAQPARTGLPTFARQADVQILAAETAVRNQRTGAVVGRYSIDSGLKKLISGTTLKVASNDGHTITLHRGAAGGEVELASNGAAMAAATATAAQAPAAAPNAEPTAIEEVIVTARKIEENAQTVPIAITALSGDQLERRGVQRVMDLQYVVPGLVFSQTATSSFSPLVSLRGQTQGTIAITTDPSIGVYVDGVYLSGTAGLASDTLLDIDRVEVLKGAQGTLFGRNTTGGAISFFTKLPTDQFEAQITGGLGSDNRQLLNGVLNLPFAGGKAGLRLVAGTYSRDGFGFDTRRNVRVGDQDIDTFRATLKWNPVDQVEVILRADWVDGQDNGNLVHPLYIVPNPALPVVGDAAVGLTGAAPTAASRLAAIAAYQALVARDPFSVAYNTPTFDTVNTANTSLTIAYDFGPVQFKSISAMRRTKDQRNYEVDASDLILFTSFTDIHLEQFTQEFQLTGLAFNDRLKFATGAFFYDLGGSESSRGYQFGNLLNGNYSLTDARVKNQSWAVYGQATLAVTDTVNLTGGLRYTKETRKAADLGGGGSNAAPFGCTLPAIYNPTPDCRVHIKLADDNVSYTLAADWTPTPGVMVYARTARGYKSGAANGRITGATPLAGATVLPEDVTDYEVGVKADLLDRRLRVNADAYRSKYNNIQRSTVICTPACTSYLQNAAKATIDGVEFEATAVPIRGLQLGIAAAYTNPEYKRYLSGGLDNSRERFLEVPKWTYSLSAGYTLPTAFGDLRGQVDWAWRSSMDMAPQDYPGNIIVVAGVPTAAGVGTPDAIRIQDSYGLLNASLNLHVERYNADVKLFGANLLDEGYYSHALGNATALGVSIGTPGAPRTWGVDVTVRF